MDKNARTRVGQVCIAVRFDLYDRDVLGQVAGVVESVVQLNTATQVQMTVVYGGKGGRRPLSAQEWETRFERDICPAIPDIPPREPASMSAQTGDICPFIITGKRGTMSAKGRHPGTHNGQHILSPAT